MLGLVSVFCVTLETTFDKFVAASCFALSFLIFCACFSSASLLFESVLDFATPHWQRLCAFYLAGIFAQAHSHGSNLVLALVSVLASVLALVSAQALDLAFSAALDAAQDVQSA